MVVLCGLLSFAAIAAAQQPGIELQLETRTIELGEAVGAWLVCTGTDRPAAPQTTVPEGLDLKLLSATPSEGSSTRVIDGRMCERTTYTYQMRLVALAEGNFMLGPVSVVAGGNKYETGPISIVVKRSDTPSLSEGDQVIFVEMDVEPRSLYVTQTYTATLTVGIRKVVIGNRTIEMDWPRTISMSSFRTLMICG